MAKVKKMRTAKVGPYTYTDQQIAEAASRKGEHPYEWLNKELRWDGKPTLEKRTELALRALAEAVRREARDGEPSSAVMRGLDLADEALKEGPGTGGHWTAIPASFTDLPSDDESKAAD